MRLIDLDPHWVVDVVGKRIGFTFVSPANARMRQSCFPNPPPRRTQWKIWDVMYADDPSIVQGCNPNALWTIAGGIEAASFDTLTVTPSIDGSLGGLWHGYITNGAIV